MMIDTLSNLRRYACLSENFARAVRFLEETPLDSLVCGSVADPPSNLQSITNPDPAIYYHIHAHFPHD